MELFGFRFGRVPLRDNNLANSVTRRPIPTYDGMGYSQFRVLNPLFGTPRSSQLYVAQASTVAGLGGLIQGQFYFQSLGANPNPNQ